MLEQLPVNTENSNVNRVTRVWVGLIVPIIIIGFWYFDIFGSAYESGEEEGITATSTDATVPVEVVSESGELIGSSGTTSDPLAEAESGNQQEQANIIVHGFIHDQQVMPLPLADQVVNVHSNNGKNYSAVSDEDGRFTLPPIFSGVSYRVWVEPVGPYNDFTKTAVQFGSDNEQLDIELNPLETGRLSGQLTDQMGAGVPNKSLLMTSSVARLKSQTITSNYDGYFYVENFPVGSVKFETHSGTHYRIDGIELTADKEGDIKLVLDTGDHRLEGSVFDLDGNVVVGAVVTLDWMHYGEGVISRSRRISITDVAGMFAFVELGPGARQVSVDADGFQTYKDGLSETVPWFVVHLTPISN
jgi:hypothetical protein